MMGLAACDSNTERPKGQKRFRLVCRHPENRTPPSILAQKRGLALVLFGAEEDAKGFADAEEAFLVGMAGREGGEALGDLPARASDEATGGDIDGFHGGDELVDQSGGFAHLASIFEGLSVRPQVRRAVLHVAC